MISSTGLSMNETGTPELVKRIYMLFDQFKSTRRCERRRTIQGASGVPGLTSLPARCGKFDNAPLSAMLNL